MTKNWMKVLFKLRRSLLILTLLFIFSATITPVIAKVSEPNSLVQTQYSSSQLIDRAKQSYLDGNYNEIEYLQNN
jgi:hypothetical protein